MRRVVQWLLTGALVLDVTYWTLWFTARDVVASEHSGAYYDFENAFPLADGWLGLACAAALVTLTLNRRSAPFWVTAAGAAGVYLCSMDLLYDLEHGIFARGGAGAFEACIVAVTAVFSATVLRYAWRTGTAHSPG